MLSWSERRNDLLLAVATEMGVLKEEGRKPARTQCMLPISPNKRQLMLNNIADSRKSAALDVLKGERGGADG